MTPDELVEHCRGQLAKFKVPKDVTFIDALPRNPSGKVLKRELRDRVMTVDRWASEVGGPVHEVGRHGVAGLVVDRRPVRGDVLDRRRRRRRGGSPRSRR